MRDHILFQMMDNYIQRRISSAFSTHEVEQIHDYLRRLIEHRVEPTRRGGGFDWIAIVDDIGIFPARRKQLETALRPALESLKREIPKIIELEQAQYLATPKKSYGNKQPSKGIPSVPTPTEKLPSDQPINSKASHENPPRRRGPVPRPIIDFPEPTSTTWEESNSFHLMLSLHMKRHRDSYWHLHRAVVRDDETFHYKTLSLWISGKKCPNSRFSFEILSRIERRYRLPNGYFRSKLPSAPRSTTSHLKLKGVQPSERRRLVWHLPEDYDRRSNAEREEILTWVRRVVIAGATDYRTYQAAAMKQKYSILFAGLLDEELSGGRPNAPRAEKVAGRDSKVRKSRRNLNAPNSLMDEMRQFIRFKTETLTAVGYQRIGVWGEETASQKLEHFGLMFGALVATPESEVAGYGAPLDAITMAMLVFPSVWDWYLRWRERRRSFFTAWEIDMLRQAQALSRKDTGWLRQNSQLVSKLKPIIGLIEPSDIKLAKKNWSECCDTLHKFASIRAKEIQRVARVHRDPFEPILPVLEADSPVGEYRKITEEILRLMPDERRHPIAAAEAVRSFLLLRIGLHSGLRQKNLRQLALGYKNEPHISEKYLVEKRHGQLRWNPRDDSWEIFIPTIAFKNATSSYFGNRPFVLKLPNIGRLYEFIDAYLTQHRSRLLRGFSDPKTFFVKTVKTKSVSAAYNQNTFYEAWRLTIQRYGIYNPYTGRGAIPGLLPHGPHNIRDVLATHILKQTGSYEQASYAIQDTPDMVAKHYGRFFPQDKSALAAQVLNQVWDTP